MSLLNLSGTQTGESVSLPTLKVNLVNGVVSVKNVIDTWW